MESSVHSSSSNIVHTTVGDLIEMLSSYAEQAARSIEESSMLTSIALEELTRNCSKKVVVER